MSEPTTPGVPGAAPAPAPSPDPSSAPTAAAAPAKKPRKPPGRSKGSKMLTPSQKAEAVALWRTGEKTLEDLSIRFKKRPETFSRLFTKMGIKKGSAAVDTSKAIAAKLEAQAASSVAVQLERIQKAKEEHWQMSNGLAKLAWAEIIRARQASLSIASLKDTFQALKLAGEVIGNARKELWEVLGVIDAEKLKELDELPTLDVRELTHDETLQLQRQAGQDEIGLEAPEELEGDIADLPGADDDEASP